MFLKKSVSMHYFKYYSKTIFCTTTPFWVVAFIIYMPFGFYLHGSFVIYQYNILYDENYKIIRTSDRADHLSFMPGGHILV